MFLRCGWVICVVWIFSAGCGPSRPKLDSRPPLHRDAAALYVAGDIEAARALFSRGLEQATAAQDPRDISRYQGGLGLCDMANHHYSQALAHFQEALTQAQMARGVDNQADLCASACNNLATVYDRMGDRDNAIRVNQEGLSYRPSPERDALLRLNLAILYASAGRWAESEKSFRELIQNARREQQTKILARALENLGYQLTTQGRLLEADAALAECIRVRQSAKDAELADAYFVMARLRLAQARHAEALDDLARYASSGSSHYWSGRVHHLRGQIHQAAGQAEMALVSFREAVTAARGRRIHVRPTANFLLSSEVTLAGLYADFIHAASAHHARTGDQKSLAEALAAAEESRVASQRAAYFTPDRWADRYSGYLHLLQKLDAAETARVPASDPALNRLKLALVASEAKMAEDEPLLVLPAPDPQRHLDRLKQSAAPDEAVFVFHISAPGSLSWLITREKVLAARLPSQAQLAMLTGEFVKLLKNKDDGAQAVGLELFTKIFGEFSQAAATKLHWTLVLDGSLFEVPFSVLPIPSGAGDEKLGKSPVLIDRHAISFLPSFFPEGKPRTEMVNRLFAGIGDPVYNAADPRFAGQRPVPQAELARLPGTAAEIERAAEIWKQNGYRTELLMGVEASTGRLRQLAARRPAILHLAAHVVPGPRIAFSLLNGSSDALSAQDVSQFRVPGTLVMMAGCASGRGAVMPGVGLVGLTRSWLLSGAEGVVANLWPLPDDTGDFPVEFYLRLSQLKKNNKIVEGSGSHRLAWARALRQAIMETRDGGRVPASIWSAYYLMGRN